MNQCKGCGSLLDETETIYCTPCINTFEVNEHMANVRRQMTLNANHIIVHDTYSGSCTLMQDAIEMDRSR